MQVAHRGLQVLVAEDGLEVAPGGTVLERVRGVGVAQAVRRETLQATRASSLPDCFLHVGLVAPPPDLSAGAWMPTGGEGWKQPCPALRLSGSGVLAIQESRQRKQGYLEHDRQRPSPWRVQPAVPAVPPRLSTESFRRPSVRRAGPGPLSNSAPSSTSLAPNSSSACHLQFHAVTHSKRHRGIKVNGFGRTEPDCSSTGDR